MSKKREDYLKKLVIEYAHSILQLVEGIKSSNINQIVSLIKANIRVLESGARKQVSDSYTSDYIHKDYN